MGTESLMHLWFPLENASKNSLEDCPSEINAPQGAVSVLQLECTVSATKPEDSAIWRAVKVNCCSTSGHPAKQGDQWNVLVHSGQNLACFVDSLI
ncbi:hypothetical protein AVEN_406-1 [Araneus ventricosus]|uniref:Uncharacterized protein n=1 Tax=Araneus ventricosus TaxID=182803 RepID=A0A4Y2RK47_ARAVE|nr:hypothetical protein AVEN_406-1 [Araneus ventricosus]